MAPRMSRESALGCRVFEGQSSLGSSVGSLYSTKSFEPGPGDKQGCGKAAPVPVQPPVHGASGCAGRRHQMMCGMALVLVLRLRHAQHG